MEKTVITWLRTDEAKTFGASSVQKLPAKIKQVNRYEAINLDWITYLDHSEQEVLLRNGVKIPVGNGFYDSLIKVMD